MFKSRNKDKEPSPKASSIVYTTTNQTKVKPFYLINVKVKGNAKGTKKVKIRVCTWRNQKKEKPYYSIKIKVYKGLYDKGLQEHKPSKRKTFLSN